VEFSFLTQNEQETFAWGNRFADFILPGDVIG
jgi:hypothetical protein